MPEKTTMKVFKETRSKLMKLKYDMGVDNVDDLLLSMMAICQKFETLESKKRRTKKWPSQ